MSSTQQEVNQGSLIRQKTDDFVMDYRFNLNNALSIIPNLRSGLGKETLRQDISELVLCYRVT